MGALCDGPFYHPSVIAPDKLARHIGGKVLPVGKVPMSQVGKREPAAAEKDDRQEGEKALEESHYALESVAVRRDIEEVIDYNLA